MSPANPLRVVVLISGSGSNLQALIDGQKRGELPIEIVAVISNRAAVRGLLRAEQAGIPALVLDHTRYESRDAFDEALQTQIDEFHPELVVLAGFMRILTSRFARHYEGKMLNIHPSLLPKHQGLHTHQRVLEAGETEHGVTVHFVTPELDGGPPVIQARVPVLENDDAATLAARVQRQEHIIYPLAIKWFACGRLQMKSGKALLDNEPLGPQGYLTDTTQP